MKNSLLLSFFIFILSSCISTNQTFFSDPNYLSSEEFSSVESINKSYPEEIISEEDSTGYDEQNYYSSDNYYDFTYSSRIRRFHNPTMYNYGYYSGFYTDYYWYNPDPFYWGSSIYSGYNWYSPYYNYYSPFYYDYYSWNHYGQHGHHHGYNNYSNYSSNYYNSFDENSYSYGPRGSLSSKNNTNNIKGNHIKNKSLLSNTRYNERFNTKTLSGIKSNNIQDSKQQTSKSNSRNQIKDKTYTKPNYIKKDNYKSKNNFKTKNRSNSFKSRSSGSRSSGNNNSGRSPKSRK